MGKRRRSEQQPSLAKLLREIYDNPRTGRIAFRHTAGKYSFNLKKIHTLKNKLIQNIKRIIVNFHRVCAFCASLFFSKNDRIFATIDS